MHLKIEIKALFNIAVTNKKDKKDIQYFNTIAIIYIIHNSSFYIMLNLNNQTIDIKTTDSTILKK